VYSRLSPSRVLLEGHATPWTTRSTRCSCIISSIHLKIAFSSDTVGEHACGRVRVSEVTSPEQFMVSIVTAFRAKSCRPEVLPASSVASLEDRFFKTKVMQGEAAWPSGVQTSRLYEPDTEPESNSWYQLSPALIRNRDNSFRLSARPRSSPHSHALALDRS